ncbi:MAG: hypothetical protein Tsb009_02660 [Planctomycetaceae bacterium]
MIFGRKKKDYEDDDDWDDEDEVVESVLFQGALNGRDANLEANPGLVRAGLVPAKDLLTDAMNRRAEKVVIEPKGPRSLARFFIDGVPYPGSRLPGKQGLAITQMVKLLAGLDINQRRKPQAGGIRAELSETPYELLVESTPIAEGVERLTIRINNLKEKLETPEDVGFSDAMRARIRELTGNHHGAFLVCGPPHSGTTTTKMAVFRCVDAYMHSLFNISDLGGRELIHVTNFEIDLEDPFEETIQKLVRKECDVLLMDPIRTAEVAKNVFEAQKKMAVVTEFTARDAAHGIAQLCQWVGDPKIVAEGLTAIISQKLVRKLCADCKQAYRPNPKLLQRVGLPPETRTLYRPPVPPAPSEEDDEEEWLPCRKCDGIGYLGRIGLFEMIEMTDSLKQLVAGGASVAEIKAFARQEHMQTLQKEGLRIAAQGITSLEELQRAFKAG